MKDSLLSRTRGRFYPQNYFIRLYYSNMVLRLQAASELLQCSKHRSKPPSHARPENSKKTHVTPMVRAYVCVFCLVDSLDMRVCMHMMVYFPLPWMSARARVCVCLFERICFEYSLHFVHESVVTIITIICLYLRSADRIPHQ